MGAGHALRLSGLSALSKDPLRAERRQPLVDASEAERSWVGPPSGLSVTVVAGSLACARPQGVREDARLEEEKEEVCV